MHQVDCIPVPSRVAILLAPFSPASVDHSQSLKALPVCGSQYHSVNIVDQLLRTEWPSKADYPAEHPQ